VAVDPPSNRVTTPDPIVVTGANGQLGRALLGRLARDGHHDVRALVRSDRARDTIHALSLSPAPDVRIVEYTSPREMEAALRGARAVVHLVGIIKETPDTRYVAAHEQTCHALALAASRAGIERIVYLSILGAAPDSDNDCLASKGRAETLLLDDRVPTTVLRVPMVLGGDDPASASLRHQAQAPSLRLVGGGRTRQQPIDARDVVNAILAACNAESGRDLALDAGGPESLSHRDLVLRAARLYDNTPRITSLPLGLARLGVSVLERVMPRPPITRAMFDILQHDDQVNPETFTKALGIELLPLDRTLADHVGPGSGPDVPAVAAESEPNPQPSSESPRPQ
jgi:NADH dehydrogenase